MLNEKKLKSNVIFSVLNTLFTLVYPLITYPYVARVLMPEGLGQYTFVIALVEYFALVAGLGIPLYGTRLVASSYKNGTDLKKECSSLFCINLISTFIVLVVYIGFIVFDSKAQENVALYLVAGFRIISVALCVEWYFQGKAQFKYIAIRNGIIKVLCVTFIFLLVKNSSDILTYAIIMVGSVFLYSLFNFFIFVKEIRPSFKHLDLKKHLMPVLFVFLIYIASKININLDTIMLNYMLEDLGNFAVGQYTAATKVINIIVDLMVAVSAVLLPNISQLLSTGNNNDAKVLLKKAFSAIFFVALPCVPGLVLVSREIVLILSGAAYEQAIPVMMLMSINVLFTTFTNFFGVQVLYSHNKEKVATLAIAFGALLNFMFNLFLIPKIGLYGAGTATVISNGSILIIEIILSRKYCMKKFLDKNSLKTVLGALVMTIALLPLFFYKVCYDTPLLALLIKVVVGVGVYFIMALLLKNDMIRFLIDELKRRIIKKDR